MTEPTPHESILINPATGHEFIRVPHRSIADTNQIIAESVRAGARWRALSATERGRLLARFARAIAADREHLATLTVTEAGHPVTAARAEADQVRDVFTYFAGAPERHLGTQIPVAGGTAITFHEPLGVVGIIAPWNFPLPIAAWGVAPALAAGNTVVLKPAELTPLGALRLEHLASEAGLPDGVFRVVTGSGAVLGDHLARHPDVAKIIFTGSTATGARVLAAAAEHIKPVTLELGGHNASVVFSDANLAAAAAATPSGALDNAGQDCCARSRVYVQRPVFDRFVDLLIPAMDALRVGDPLDPHTQLGPLISAAHRDRVAALVTDDIPVVYRGRIPEGPGFWFPPTVVAPPPHHPILATEVFGPVLALLPFDAEDEVITRVNSTPYGLAGSIWTRDGARGLRTARAIRAGNLSINSQTAVRYQTPFGGMKQSGLGRELGPDALDAVTEVKTVFISHDGPHPSTQRNEES